MYLKSFFMKFKQIGAFNSKRQSTQLNCEDSDRSNLPEIALAYVGSVVPDELEFHNAAFSRAGVMFQQNLLFGLKRVGLNPSQIFSIRQIQSFPPRK